MHLKKWKNKIKIWKCANILETQTWDIFYTGQPKPAPGWGELGPEVFVHENTGLVS